MRALTERYTKVRKCLEQAQAAQAELQKAKEELSREKKTPKTYTIDPSVTLQDLLTMRLDEFVLFLRETQKEYKNIEGIAEIYGCSYGTAKRIKASGLIDGAITQVSPRVFYTDILKSLRLYPREYVIRKPRK